MDAVSGALRERASPWPIGPDGVDGLLRTIRPLRVAVIGDFCLDVYLVVDPAAADISVETGLPTRPVAELHRTGTASPREVGELARAASQRFRPRSD